MKTYLNITILLFCSFFFIHCKKNRCFKSAGPADFSLVSLSPFDTVEITGDNYNLYLKKDSSYYAEISGGKNLIPFVEFKIHNKKLTIDDRNQCRWLRSYKSKPEVTLHMPDLKHIIYRGAGDIITLDTIRNNFSLESWDGSGSIRLKIHTDSLFLFSHTGPIDIHVEGIAGYVYAYNNGNGFIYLQNLKSPRVFVNASGTGDTHIAPLQYTGYEIYSYGNIYCYTHPSILYEVTKGKGSFILVN